MNWWGKIIGGGFGFMLGGPLGALLGAALGHQLDRNLVVTLDVNAGQTQRTQAAFFTAIFAVMGYVAKADGKVSKDEIGMAEQLMTQMRLSAEQRRAAIELFNRGKQSDFEVNAVLQQFRSECHRQRNLMQMFLEILIATAMADGALHSAEHEALKRVTHQLGFGDHHLEQLISMIGARHPAQPAASRTLEDAYQILGVSADASDDDVKKAYRRLMSQHHPDKLVSRGLPEEMIRLATEKTADIKSAYEQIRSARGE
ncbi:MAG: co-chaperone DjlA [Gammaproteobacteria bacterium]|nr:co-chaperone DjlA [Gammaproteobacteria bacterium]